MVRFYLLGYLWVFHYIGPIYQLTIAYLSLCEGKSQRTLVMFQQNQLGQIKLRQFNWWLTEYWVGPADYLPTTKPIKNIFIILAKA